MEHLAAEYLSKKEVSEVSNLLQKNGIKFIVKELGYSNIRRIKTGNTNQSYYNIFIQDEDYDKGGRIVKGFKKSLELKHKLERLNCRKCNSGNKFTIIKSKNIIEKIIAFGVDIVICKKCGNKWYI